MISKHKISLIFYLLVCLFYSGCGRRENVSVIAECKTTEEGIDYYDSANDLENGNYYVCHNGMYEKLYIGETSFDTSRSISSGVAWFMDDFSKIPTLYTGDQLVYYTTDVLDESFSLQRFLYDGYTIGICNLTEEASGRYSFSTQSGTSLNSKSDALQLSDLNSSKVIIDSIGSSSLRSGNITEGGTIKGLKEKNYYKVAFYVGTELSTYVLCADSIALHAEKASETLTDYSFLQSSVLQVNIPSNYHSGYYYIPGCGMFRYVDGTSYDENTDFNIENETAAVTQQDNTEQEINDEKSAVEETSFVLKKNQAVKIQVEYFVTSNSQEYLAAPKVSLLGDNVNYDIEEDNGIFEGTYNLPAGKYTLKIVGLDGRKYTYQVTPVSEDKKAEDGNGRHSS